MLTTKKNNDVKVAPMPRDGRWAGVSRLFAREGVVGTIVDSLATRIRVADDRPLPVERVEPWLSSRD
jgi:hypothetical protein